MMFRLLLLLGSTMFLTMLIGGQDYGQSRLGLKQPDAPAVVQQTQANPEIVPAATLPVDAPATTLATYATTEPVAIAQPTPVAASTAPEPVIETAIVVAAVDPEPVAELPVLFVNSRAINVREGPSTNFSVIGRLTRDEAVTVVEPQSNGWVRIRMEGDGIEGFVSGRLLTDEDPNAN
jgi:hypothetical protein